MHNLTHRARIDGLWEVTLRPTDASHIPEGGNRGPITAYLLITQSWWSTYIEQLTAESKSTSRANVWEERAGAPVERLSFLYDNEPDPNLDHRSTHHLGVCTLDPGQLNPKVMQGTYFTDRYTKGSMDLRFVGRSRSYSTYGEAGAAVSASGI